LQQLRYPEMNLGILGRFKNARPQLGQGRATEFDVMQ
jgi:hypothetical protein